jgi:ligand-binding SRPBCC domain-containing protein
MPVFERVACYPRPVAEVFDFFCQPGHLLTVSPPELHMRLKEAPERLQLGSRIVVRARRYGFGQRITSEVTAFEPNALMVDEQKEGPFGKWIHTHRFETVPEGTQVTDRIEFEPPPGLVGMMVTASVIEKELQRVFEFRQQKLAEIFANAKAEG